MAHRREFASLRSFDTETKDNTETTRRPPDLCTETPQAILIKHLSIWSKTSTTSLFTKRQQNATEASEMQPFIQIGAGTCGTVYEQAGNPLCAKKEKSHTYMDRNLRNDHEMHVKIYEAIKKHDIDIHVPLVSHFVDASNQRLGDESLSLFPAGDQTKSSLLFTERILPLPKPVQEALIDVYCPAHIKTAAREHPANKNCLIRLYLGQIQRPRSAPLCFFSLNNFALHTDQFEDLELEVAPFVSAMAKALAVMHYAVQVDARDVEFVLGAAPTSTESHNFTQHYNCVSREVHLWLLDFNQVTSITMDKDGVSKAVDAFRMNDPYYPRPGRGSDALWAQFKKDYIIQSEMILDYSSLHLADQFLSGVEEMQQKTEEHAQAAKARLRDQTV